MRATDLDSLHFGTVEYSIDERIEGEEKEGLRKGKKEKKRLPFEIGRENGEVRLSGKIDYEKTKDYRFDVSLLVRDDWNILIPSLCRFVQQMEEDVILL